MGKIIEREKEREDSLRVSRYRRCSPERVLIYGAVNRCKGKTRAEPYDIVRTIVYRETADYSLYENGMDARQFPATRSLYFSFFVTIRRSYPRRIRTYVDYRLYKTRRFPDPTGR